MLNYINKVMKKMRWWDVSLVKMSVFFATLLLLKIWPAFRNFADNTNAWVFLALMLIFIIRPLCLWFKK